MGERTPQDVLRELARLRSEIGKRDAEGRPTSWAFDDAARAADFVGMADALDKAIAEAPDSPDTLRQLVAQQAEDEGLWFVARTAPEAYLQQELRRLHAAIEAPDTLSEKPGMKCLLCGSNNTARHRETSKHRTNWLVRLFWTHNAIAKDEIGQIHVVGRTFQNQEPRLAVTSTEQRESPEVRFR